MIVDKVAVAAAVVRAMLARKGVEDAILGVESAKAARDRAEAEYRAAVGGLGTLLCGGSVLYAGQLVVVDGSRLVLSPVVDPVDVTPPPPPVPEPTPESEPVVVEKPRSRRRGSDGE